MGYKLGLDTGISYIGYAIYDDVQESFIESGVHHFDRAMAKDNKDRREKRGSRRLLRRKHHRLECADRLFKKYGLTNRKNNYNYPKGVTVYHLQCKGLKEKLTNDELVASLRHIIKNRGSSGFEVSETDKGKTKKVLSENEKLLNGRYVCELQLERLLDKNRESVHGVDNNFMLKDHVNDALQILHTQQKYNPLVTDEFINKYIDILTRKREYFEGPGNNGNPNQYGAGAKSPYGWENQEVWMNSLRGKCSYFPDEIRMVLGSPTSEIFNLLNDLNNLTIDDKKLSKEQKEKLVNELFKKQNKVTSLDKILKCLNMPNANITGYRINKKNEPVFTSLIGYRLLTQCDKDIDWVNGNIDLMDEIASIISTYQTVKDIKTHLIKDLDAPITYAEKASEIINSSSNPFKGTHSLSKKAISLVLNDLWDTSKNQMQLFTEKNVSVASSYISDGKHISSTIINNLSVSADTRRALYELIKIINRLCDKYGTFDDITIEMPRGEINKYEDLKKQRKFEELNSEVTKKIGANNSIREKIKLWIMQDGLDFYTGNSINLENIKSNPEAYEIDHIIPLSISFDNSLNNRVLTTRTNNQNKGQRTPYQWMSENEFDKFKRRIENDYNGKKENDNKYYFTLQKLTNALFAKDTNKWEIRTSFINRNLTDTQYASRELLSILKEHIKQTGEITKINTINGKFTHQLRQKFNIEAKNRDTDNSHHAIDAMLIAISPIVLYSIPTYMYYIKNKNIPYDAFKYFNDKRYKEIIGSIGKVCKEFCLFQKENINYTHSIDKKINRKYSDETLYSTRIEYDEKGKRHEYLISTIKDIYSEKLDSKIIQKLNDFFGVNHINENNLLMYLHDIETYKICEEIWQKYYIDNKHNPFTEYFKTYGYIKKYAKKNNGPAIKSFKYKISEINSNPIDISKKQNVKKENVRILLSGKSVHHIEIYNNGVITLILPIPMINMMKTGEIKNYDLLKQDRNITDDYKMIGKLYSGTIFAIDSGEKMYYKGFSGGNRIIAYSLNDNTKYSPSISKTTTIKIYK